jgi:adenine/guanine phosphoribosyltransferase-like PRPP-binding protein
VGADTYLARVGSQAVELPIVPLDDTLAIALLITVDLGVAFCERAGAELAARLEDLGVEVVVSVATMGIPVAIEVARALRQDGYVILHKTPKIHLADAVAEPVRSITTATPQRLLLDRRRVPAVEGRRVAVVDDVVSTGASAAAALRLLRRVGAQPVAVAALVSEGIAWRDALGEDASLVRVLGELPLFSPGDGGYRALEG